MVFFPYFTHFFLFPISLPLLFDPTFFLLFEFLVPHLPYLPSGLAIALIIRKEGFTKGALV